MIDQHKDVFKNAAENPLFETLAGHIASAESANSYGKLDDCLENISEIFKQLVDMNPADPKLAEILPFTIAILDKYSLTFDTRSMDAIEYVEGPAQQLLAAGDNRLSNALKHAVLNLTHVGGGYSLKDFDIAPPTKSGPKP